MRPVLNVIPKSRRLFEGLSESFISDTTLHLSKPSSSRYSDTTIVAISYKDQSESKAIELTGGYFISTQPTESIDWSFFSIQSKRRIPQEIWFKNYGYRGRRCYALESPFMRVGTCQGAPEDGISVLPIQMAHLLRMLTDLDVYLLQVNHSGIHFSKSRAQLKAEANVKVSECMPPFLERTILKLADDAAAIQESRRIRD